ncbi:hypothetical protein LPJ63_001249 [Coemansia sp. RSA 2711]|nr:hypothetical protein LPJ63_001249 [Coemansia sp. RSA 2711]KAJ1842856.1 hypothetical protein LPJ70_003636 [Coemansia sp. RSA 2708]KAJ2303813.1 hypothetical protein IWW54_005615 [Coemansia sp. RSA 2705]KAJ2314244.1 hypothetical protein IWW52_004342 [Coemansia sp. RSA 2704]KAJ2390551.1 hypothetical protein H4S02_001798 [Coemansia sp. RSA 2611]KAJ2724625.1 hypothetical protein H4R23_004239 [Coemansia sp. Cherry 401B]
MEVLDRQEALITNYEALLVLREENQRRNRKKAENVSTLTFEALAWLEKTPCASQSPDQIVRLKEKLQGYKLMKGEILQIFNLRPQSLVELNLIVEECTERFTMDKLSELIALIVEELPHEAPAKVESAPEDGEQNGNGSGMAEDDDAEQNAMDVDIDGTG